MIQAQSQQSGRRMLKQLIYMKVNFDHNELYQIDPIHSYNTHIHFFSLFGPNNEIVIHEKMSLEAHIKCLVVVLKDMKAVDRDPFTQERMDLFSFLCLRNILVKV